MDHANLHQPSRSCVRLGRAIRSRRKSLRLTQIELGRLAGCGLAFLYELESGKSTVRLDKLLAVLSVLGLGLSLAEGKRSLAVDDRWLDEVT